MQILAWLNCWLGFPCYLLDETFKLLCELNRKKKNPEAAWLLEQAA